MKHKLSITLILLGMFLITQFIGLYVINAYTPIQKTIINDSTGELQTIIIDPLPIIFQNNQLVEEIGFVNTLIQVIIPSFIFAILLILILTKYKLKLVIKLWFFLVIFIAIFLALNALLMKYPDSWKISMGVAFILTFLKIIRPSVIIHNVTELMIYPGISAIFVPILSVWSIIILLIIISIYDMWAVWHSGIMQKMAKFQMEEIGVFGGFLIPSISKQVRDKIRKLRKTNKKDKKIKISLAILGGGDVIFPIITAGVFMRAQQLGVISASVIPVELFIIFGAFFGLGFLLMISQKKKFYPAMPFITAGIFLGLLIWKILTLIN